MATINMNTLQNIINLTSKQPTIINENSNFVVITYWWGRNNYNQNTARPCVSYYESLFKKFINFFINLMLSTAQRVKEEQDSQELIDKKIFTNIKLIFKNYKSGIKPKAYDNLLTQKAKQYLGMVYEYCGVSPQDANPNQEALMRLEKLKLEGKCPANYEFKDETYLKNMLDKIVSQSIIINEKEIVELYTLNARLSLLREQYTSTDEKGNVQFTGSKEETLQIKNQIDNLTKQKSNIFLKITQSLKIKRTYEGENLDFFGQFQNQSLFDILNSELRYLNPIKFEEMISLWEKECSDKGCNYLSVEYPEFAQPGGYQMAINAKPLFIQKALTLCGNRSVLYIDGDMYIRKYPEIFDMTDVDFMSRGWWIDPRSSYKMEESIMYDPYTFETSGGTMFFTQSNEAKTLIRLWIEEALKPNNIGKADDRVLSLIFNAKTYLCCMKIIQLPIEYLWLSLDYDERLLEEVYDYNVPEMKQSIFIEHPECLTSEDTAAGAGASSDRTPKFYSFLSELTPASEELHEYLFFPNKEMTKSFKNYFDYLKDTQYKNDGNPVLINKGYIFPNNPEMNEQPVYVIDYDDKYGNRLYFKKDDLDENEQNYTINEIAKINNDGANNMNITSLGLIDKGNNYTEIQNANNIIDDKKMIKLIIRLLNDGKNVIYNPVNKNCYDINLYNKLISNMDTTYASLDFVFVPIITSFNFSDFFKPIININQPILFRPTNKFLVEYLKMFLTLADMSSYVNNGSYELISRTRVGYLFPPKKTSIKNNDLNLTQASSESVKIQTGGNQLDINYLIDNYENNLEELYGNSVGGRKIKKIKTIKKIYKKLLTKKIKINKKNKKTRGNKTNNLTKRK